MHWNGSGVILFVFPTKGLSFMQFISQPICYVKPNFQKMLLWLWVNSQLFQTKFLDGKH